MFSDALNTLYFMVLRRRTLVRWPLHTIRNISAMVAQWLRHLSQGWQVLSSHLNIGSKPEEDFKRSVGRCKATTSSYHSLTLNKLGTHGQSMKSWCILSKYSNRKCIIV